MRRLFIAIELPENILDLISETISDLKKSIKGKFVNKEKLHITVLFLGDPPTPDSKIIDAVASIKLDRTITISGLGSFEKSGKGKGVLFLKIETDLSDIHKELSSKLGMCNSGEFIPHITLCRTDDVFDVSKLSEKVNLKASFVAEKLSLMKSDLKKYERIF